jgi:putative PIN family toxin of toxin-antitoxin system
MRFLSEAVAGSFHLHASSALMDEVREVLARKFGWAGQAITGALLQMEACITLVHPTQTINAVPDDPDDNRVLECAVTANSRYIVTGDGDLLRLGSYAGISILRVADFLRLLPSRH